MSALLDARALVADAPKLELIKRAKPWLSDIKHFKRVQINAVAALKMARRFRSQAVVF